MFQPEGGMRQMDKSLAMSTHLIISIKLHAQVSAMMPYREYNPDSAGTRRDECLVETHLDRSLVGKQRVNSWW